MATRLRTITDNIHESIYLSEFEYDFIRTPYFFRLHDVYQSSTVYMTYPSNRTKRYEHSIGTMELASNMLFSAVSNSDLETREVFFKRLKRHCDNIIEKIISKEPTSASYYNQISSLIDELFSGEAPAFDEEWFDNAVSSYIEPAIKAGKLKDPALDHFQFYSMEMNVYAEEEKEPRKAESYATDYVLYRCLLEAIRIVALFHDIGHPPYSHVVETSLERLYKALSTEDDGKYDSKKKKKFLTIMKKFASKRSEDAYKCNMLYNHSSVADAALHERVSLYLLQSAIDDVIPERIKKVNSTRGGADYNRKEENTFKIGVILYNILVVELAISILVEKDILFHSIHTIVDGVIDADRLDYIMRDANNAGVDWGKIPYKRIIESSRLFMLKKFDIPAATAKVFSEDDCPFIIAYPHKMADDLVDILTLRYEIFARINWHHGCMKSALTLQSCVEELAKDYFLHSEEDDAKCINSDIKVLWEALDQKVGIRVRRIMQWNDSWMITTLNNALIKIYSISVDGRYSRERVNSIRSLKENLEEILLNRKRFYALIKRGEDNSKFTRLILNKAGITPDVLNSDKDRELRKKYALANKRDEDMSMNLLESEQKTVDEAIIRLNEFLQIYDNGDIEALNTFLPLSNKCVGTTIENELEYLKGQGRIEDYKTIENRGRNKLGLPSLNVDSSKIEKQIFGQIYLYDKEPFPYDDRRVFLPLMESMMHNVPWLLIYVVPPSKTDQVEEKMGLSFQDQILDYLAEKVAEKIRDRYCELFPNSELFNQDN